MPTPIPHVTTIELRRETVPDFARYPFSIPAIATLELLTLHPSVTFFVGENGSGKSTLLEGIAVALGLNPEGGSRNFNFSTMHRASGHEPSPNEPSPHEASAHEPGPAPEDTPTAPPSPDDTAHHPTTNHSALGDHLRIRRTHRRDSDFWFLRAESFFTVATEIDDLDRRGGGRPLINSYGGRSLHTLSHGESFHALFNHRFSSGLYLLDEPEAALSPTRQLAFLARLHDLVLQGAQFIIATHSPIIMAYPDALIYAFGPGPLAPVAYAETEHFRVTRDFLSHPERSLRVLMERPFMGAGE